MAFDFMYFLVFDGSSSSSDATRLRLTSLWFWCLFYKTQPQELTEKKFKEKA